MFIIQNYPVAVAFCFITMLCWGSWANTTKLADKSWRFELFYWDYAFGILLFSILFAFTLGSTGSDGRSFLPDIRQADTLNLWSSFFGGVWFNLANILLGAAISIAGMSVAFPVGIGIALIMGVVVNYIDNPIGNPVILFGGVGLIAVAILLNAYAYKKLNSGSKGVSTKGLILSVAAGLLMGIFYKYVADSMFSDFSNPIPGKLSPYTALVFFAIGIVASNFIFNGFLMFKPFIGAPIPLKNYFQGSFKNHIVGFLGGIIWNLGMSFSILASDKAGPAISYGLGQGATIVAAIWGIFIWKEFKYAPKGTNIILNIMLVLYVVGLAMLIFSKA